MEIILLLLVWWKFPVFILTSNKFCSQYIAGLCALAMVGELWSGLEPMHLFFALDYHSYVVFNFITAGLYCIYWLALLIRSVVAKWVLSPSCNLFLGFERTPSWLLMFEYSYWQLSTKNHEGDAFMYPPALCSVRVTSCIYISSPLLTWFSQGSADTFCMYEQTTAQSSNHLLDAYFSTSVRTTMPFIPLMITYVINIRVWVSHFQKSASKSQAVCVDWML